MTMLDQQAYQSMLKHMADSLRRAALVQCDHGLPINLRPCTECVCNTCADTAQLLKQTVPHLEKLT